MSVDQVHSRVVNEFVSEVLLTLWDFVAPVSTPVNREHRKIVFSLPSADLLGNMVDGPIRKVVQQIDAEFPVRSFPFQRNSAIRRTGGEQQRAGGAGRVH